MLNYELISYTIHTHQIHYVDEGQGQVLLFSHAPLGSSFMFRRFIRLLSRSYRCIALDYPGFGLSSDQPDQAYSIVTQSEVLDQFIQHLHLKDVIALGHDTGGPSLFKVAVDHPDWFKGLILTDTLIFPTTDYPKIHTMLKIVGSSFLQTVNAWTNFLVRLTFSKGVVTRKLLKEEIAQYRTLFNTGAKRRRITQLLYSLRQEAACMRHIQHGFEQQLRDKPALLIYGEDDPVAQLGVPDRIHAMLPNSDLYFIKKEGHFPHEGQPENMTEIIDQWVRKLQVVERAEVL